MRRLITAVVLGALACMHCGRAGRDRQQRAGAEGVEAAEVGGSVSLLANPSTVTGSTTTISVSGNVMATSGCRKNRTLAFSYVGAGGTTPLTVTAVSGPNGDFAASLPKPADAAPATVTLQATAGQVDRRVGSAKKGKKPKKGRKITCLSATGQTTLTVAP